MAEANETVPTDGTEILRKKFQILKDEVPIFVFTREGENQAFNRFIVALVKQLQKLSAKIRPYFHSVGDEISKKYDVTRSPTILVDPDRYHIRYTGSPAGEEMRSLLDIIVTVSLNKSFLSDQSRHRLSELNEPRHVRVFVSPT